MSSFTAVPNTSPFPSLKICVAARPENLLDTHLNSECKVEEGVLCWPGDSHASGKTWWRTCSLRCGKGRCFEVQLPCDWETACQLCKTFISFLICVPVVSVCTCLCTSPHAWVHVCARVHRGPVLTLLVSLCCLLLCTWRQTLPELSTHL